MDGQHISMLPPLVRENVDLWLNRCEVELGESEFHTVKEGYELAENECWVGKDKKQVETKIKIGVCNDTCVRMKANGVYYLELGRSVPQWPWAMTVPRSTTLV